MNSEIELCGELDGDWREPAGDAEVLVIPDFARPEPGLADDKDWTDALAINQHGLVHVDATGRVSLPIEPGTALLGRFHGGTRSVVVSFGRLGPGPLVLPQAAWMAVRRTRDRWVVFGRVVDAVGIPVVGARIELWDADLLEHDPLGATTTAADGRYRVDFPGSAFRKALVGHFEGHGGPDLFVRVTGAGGERLLDEEPHSARNRRRADVGPITRLDVRLSVAVPDERFARERTVPRGVDRVLTWHAARRATPDGRAPDRWMEGAREAIRAIRRPTADHDDPGPPPPGRTTATGSARISRVELPAPGDARPWLARPAALVEVEDTPTDVAIGLAPADVSHLDPGSLRLFRWDTETETWALVERSGVGRDGSYVWGHATRPGRYGIFGLPRDEAARVLLGSIALASRLTPLGHAEGVVQRLAAALFPPQLVRSGILGQPKLLAELGLPDHVTNLRLVIGRELGDFPRDAKGKPIGPPAGYPMAFFGLSGGIGGGGRGGLEDLPGDRGGWREPGDRQWEPDDPICPDPPWTIPELKLIDFRRWLIPKYFDVPERLPNPCNCTGWESMGPTNIPGRVQSLAWEPGSTSTVYIGSAGGGVWKSTDAGKTWSPRMHGELLINVGAVAVAPSLKTRVYAATAEYHNGASSAARNPGGEGVFKSTDGADDWDRLPSGCSTQVSEMVVHPTRPDEVYVAGNLGVHRWSTTTSPPAWKRLRAGACTSIVFDPNNAKRVYLAVEGSDAVVKTDDIDAVTITWTAMKTGLTIPAGAPNYGKLAIGSGSDAVLWLSLNASPASGKAFDAVATVYRWSGTRWDSKGQHGGATYGGWCNSIAVHPTNPKHVIVGALEVEWTTDGGSKWMKSTGVHGDQHAIAFCPARPSLTLIGNDGGVYRNDSSPFDGAFTPSSGGLVTAELINVCVSRKGSFALGGSTQDNGVVKTDRTGTFMAMGGNEWGIFEIDPNDPKIIYQDAGDTVLIRTTTGTSAGNTAVMNDIPKVGAPAAYPEVVALAVKPGDSNRVLVATDNDKVYLSTNGTSNWKEVVANTTSHVARFYFAPSNSSRVYFITDGGVWRSDDSGDSFTRVNGATLPPGILCGLSVGWTNADHVFVCFGGTGTGRGHVWRSTDAGVTWVDVSGARSYSRLPDLPFYAVIPRKGTTEEWYAATDLGVFRTTDEGDWWYPFDEELPNAQITDMDYSPALDTLYVSTAGRGFWRRQL